MKTTEAKQFCKNLETLTELFGTFDEEWEFNKGYGKKYCNIYRLDTDVWTFELRVQRDGRDRVVYVELLAHLQPLGNGLINVDMTVQLNDELDQPMEQIFERLYSKFVGEVEEIRNNLGKLDEALGEFV